MSLIQMGCMIEVIVGCKIIAFNYFRIDAASGYLLLQREQEVAKAQHVDLSKGFAKELEQDASWQFNYPSASPP